MLFFSRSPVVPVLRFTGPIGMVTPLRPGLAMASVAGPIEKAFSLSKLPSVAVVINSPGGSPVQSHLIFNRIRQLAAEKEKRVYVFCEDVAASGGYFLALAGDEIYADPSSIVGSIGVISASFGLDKLIDRFGIERRVHASGKDKGALDPFQPEQADDVARLKDLQRHVHEVFIGIVKERRAGKLVGTGGGAILRRLLDGGQGLGVRADRRRGRCAQQDAGPAREKGAAARRPAGARRAALALPALARPSPHCERRSCVCALVCR